MVIRQTKKADQNQRGTQIWAIAFWVLVIGVILTCLLSEARADEEESAYQESHKAVLVTEDNFEKIQHQLKDDDLSITSLKMEFIVNKKKLEKLKDAIENNTELGYISWHEEQVFSEDLGKIETKLISNNQNYQHHPNDYIHALLSAHAYIDAKVDDSVILNDYNLDDNTKSLARLACGEGA